jgi:large subunit ribosomal protein L16
VFLDLNFGFINIKFNTMLFTPKSSKYKKSQKGSLPNKLKNNYTLSDWAIKSTRLIAVSFGNISAQQLSAVRFLIKKYLKKKAFIKFSVFPQRAVSKKPSEIRMGKGKGNFSHWSANVKVGTVICEIFYKLKLKRRVFKVLKRAQIRFSLATRIKD